MFILLAWFIYIWYIYVVLCINPSGNCSKTVLPEQFDVTGGQRTSLYCTLSETKSNSCWDEALPSQFEGPSVGPPGSIDVDGTLVLDPRNHSSPQMVIKWTAPANASLIQNLTGFLVTIRKYNIGKETFTDYCKLFDLSNDRFNSTDVKLKFEKRWVRFPGGSGFYYKVKIFSLPRSPSDVGVSKYFTLRPYHNQRFVPANYWAPFISYDEVNLTAPATLVVTFNMARDEYAFTQYKVTLVSLADSNNYLKRCIASTESNYTCQNQEFQPPHTNQTTVQVSFNDIAAGMYYIEIQPVDPYRHDGNRCLCHSSSTGQCDTCLVTRAARFNVHAAPLTSSTIAMSVKVNDTGPTYTFSGLNTHSTTTAFVRHGTEEGYVVMLAAIGGSVLGLALIAIFACIIYQNRRCPSGSNAKENHNYKQTSNNMPLENTKGTRVLIVNTDDHIYHRTAVTKFALYLSNICKLEVEYLPFSEGRMSEDEKYDWIINTMNVVNFIIVINSRIAFETYHSRSSDSLSKESFNYAISHMLANSSNENYFQKYVFVNFSYTEDKFCIKDINPTAQFQIPERLNYFICWLNGIDSHLDMNVENNQASLTESCKGRDLHEAIKRVGAYQKTNPNWYQRRLLTRASATLDQCQDQDEVFSVSEMGEVRKHDSGVQSDDIITIHSGNEKSSFFVGPSDIDSEMLTVEAEDQLYAITTQYEAKHCGISGAGHATVPPSLSDSTDASTNTMEDRLLDFNIKQGTTGLISRTRVRENKTSKHAPHNEKQTDGVDAPSIVNSETTDTTSVIMEKLGGINRSRDIHIGDSSGDNSGLTRRVVYSDLEKQTASPTQDRSGMIVPLRISGAGKVVCLSSYESTSSQLDPQCENRTDVSYWAPLSTVDSEASTNMIMDKLSGINPSRDRKDSISDRNSELTKQAGGDSGFVSSEPESVCELLEVSDGTATVRNKKTDIHENVMRLDSVLEHEERERVGYDSDYSSSSFHSPKDVHSDVSTEDINQQLFNMNADVDMHNNMNTHM